jgi:hypothetical protein
LTTSSYNFCGFQNVLHTMRFDHQLRTLSFADAVGKDPSVHFPVFFVICEWWRPGKRGETTAWLRIQYFPVSPIKSGAPAITQPNRASGKSENDGVSLPSNPAHPPNRSQTLRTGMPDEGCPASSSWSISAVGLDEPEWTALRPFVRTIPYHGLPRCELRCGWWVAGRL